MHPASPGGRPAKRANALAAACRQRG